MGITAVNEDLVNYSNDRNNGSMRSGGYPVAERSKREQRGKVT